MRAIEKAALDVLDAGYDNGFGVTSLDTIVCEQMPRASREDFARFITRAAVLAFLDGVDVEALARARIERDGGKWEYMGKVFQERECEKLRADLSALRAQAENA